MSETPERPSVVLHGFHGGIVYSGDIASRLAKIILGGLSEPDALDFGSPLQAQDRGDVWSIIGTDRNGAPAGQIVIRKRDAAVLSLAGYDPSQVLGNRAIAEEFATVLAATSRASARIGPPFTVTDGGSTWLVRGSNSADRALEGLGPFHLELRKRDAKVIDMWFDGVLHAPTRGK